MRHSFGILLVALLSPFAAACSTSEDCTFTGLDCAALATERARIEGEYTAELAKEHYDALPAIAACSRAVVRAQMASPGACGLTVCGEICRLHPCEELETSACEQQCVSASASFTAAQMNAILDRAAETPGLCTCDVCAADTFTFCVDMWQCSNG